MENSSYGESKTITVEKEIDKKSFVYVGRDGWPVEGIKNRPIITFIRRLLHTKNIVRYGTWLKKGGCKIVS